MGDRTSVTLTMAREHFEQILGEPWFDQPDLINENSISMEAVRSNRSLSLPKSARVSLSYEAVNYGELAFLGELRDRGIAYESSWGDGDEYREGDEYCRFTEHGDLQLLRLYEGDEDPPIEELRQRLTKPLQLVEYIKQYDHERTPLPWDNQVEYGKRYLTKQLLKPTQETSQ